MRGQKMEQVYSSVKSAFRRVTGSMAMLSEWVLLTMTLIVFYDVVMRYIFNSPTMWVLEMSEYMLVFVGFIGTAEIQARKGNIRMDFLYLKFSSGMKRAADVFISLLMAIFSFLLLRASLMMTIAAYKYDSASNSLLEIPLFLPYSIVAIGTFFLLLQSIVDIVESVRQIILHDQPEGR